MLNEKFELCWGRLPDTNLKVFIIAFSTIKQASRLIFSMLIVFHLLEILRGQKRKVYQVNQINQETKSNWSNRPTQSTNLAKPVLSLAQLCPSLFFSSVTKLSFNIYSKISMISVIPNRLFLPDQLKLFLKAIQNSLKEVINVLFCLNKHPHY